MDRTHTTPEGWPVYRRDHQPSNVLFVFRRRGTDVVCMCIVKPPDRTRAVRPVQLRAAEKQKEMGLGRARFYKQATPPGLSASRACSLDQPVKLGPATDGVAEDK